jgi:phage shock protein C
VQVNRRLYRCRHNRLLAGVAAGVAEFLDLDPTLVRVLWFVSIFFGGISILLYVGLAIIVPLEPLSDDDVAHEATMAPEGHRHAKRGSGWVTTFIGVVLVLFGTLAFVDALSPGWAAWARYLWPLLLVGIGALLIARALRREPTE